MGVNFTGKEDKVDWGVLSKSILNKFAPGHSMLNHQLDQMKSHQANFQKKIEKNNFKRRAKSKKIAKVGEVAPICSGNGFQKLVEKKQKKREQIYSHNPELMKVAELQDTHEMNKLQLEMIMNGMKQDENGNYILRSHNTKKNEHQFKKVKSRFRNYLGSK
mmetsp:Transcript_21681/g.21359  ORF Transcript_21681/g.21359 Transcript_21681/m.21359 type:complete len:161 (-) Transcript_21681:675-1157(-)|eukprot:CAMPEP_0196996172 /NCGR_PEP_ID=MMETSP1380-20130617/2121_1 /TAXON_ID=5936 /ORGANISM="Euplotes crassus, Strain CT5" /LENGTH=160 /DNA_ID=CAMNT_0042412061 /DNA_START=256 /DNA_END=738 /DNA_ORIENTATION=+